LPKAIRFWPVINSLQTKPLVWLMQNIMLRFSIAKNNSISLKKKIQTIQFFSWRFMSLNHEIKRTPSVRKACENICLSHYVTFIAVVRQATRSVLLLSFQYATKSIVCAVAIYVCVCVSL
jgi:hypothetical protein